MYERRSVYKRSVKAFDERSYKEEIFGLSKRQPRPPVEFPIVQELRHQYDRVKKVKARRRL